RNCCGHDGAIPICFCCWRHFLIVLVVAAASPSELCGLLLAVVVSASSLPCSDRSVDKSALPRPPDEVPDDRDLEGAPHGPGGCPGGTSLPSGSPQAGRPGAACG